MPILEIRTVSSPSSSSRGARRGAGRALRREHRARRTAGRSRGARLSHHDGTQSHPSLHDWWGWAAELVSDGGGACMVRAASARVVGRARRTCCARRRRAWSILSAQEKPHRPTWLLAPSVPAWTHAVRTPMATLVWQGDAGGGTQLLVQVHAEREGGNHSNSSTPWKPPVTQT